MAQLAISFALSYITNRLSQPDGPRLQNLKGFSADYGAQIALVYGPTNRVKDATVIWATEIKETVHKHKPAADYLFGLVGAFLPARKTYTYSIDFAVLLCGNPIESVEKVWAQKKVVFDAAGPIASAPAPGIGGLIAWAKGNNAHQVFTTMRVYTGTFTQLPDPTIEADKGVGNVPGYLGCSYVVFDDYQLADTNNAVPNELEFLVKESGTGKLRRIVTSLIEAAGIDSAHLVSSTSLEGDIRGFQITSAASVADALQPLTQAFDFDAADIAGELRFTPRGRYPRSVITADQLGAYAAQDDRPEPIRWKRKPEVVLPREVAITYADASRDYQPNTAVTRRLEGSAENNISTSLELVLTPDEAQKVADKVMWEAWSVRQAAETTIDDARDDVGAAEVHAFQTPNGIDTYRVTRRSRGANGVIELDLVADRPLLYNTDLPGVSADLPSTTVSLPGPVNDPIIVEAPTTVTTRLPTVLIGLSGVTASGGDFDPAWPGVYVYVSADGGANYLSVGFVDAPSYMGVLSANLPAYGAANPDNTNTLSVSLIQSGGILETIAAADAADGLNLFYIKDSPTAGEFGSFQTATATSAYHYDVTGIYRALFGTTGALHGAGAQFLMIDQAVFRYSIPPSYVGKTLRFKFPQPNQELVDVPYYSFTPTGASFGGGTGGTPTTLAAPSVSSAGGINLVSWTAALLTDGVTSNSVYRATGASQPFSAAALLANVGTATSYPDTTAVAGTTYTYFVVPTNLIGAGTESPGANQATSSSGGATVAITASEALTAGQIVTFWDDAGTAKVRKSQVTDDTKTAQGFVKANVALGGTATVYLPGQVDDAVSGLTPGDLCYLAANGGITQVRPSSGWMQIVGVAADATHLVFIPEEGFLLG